MPKPTKRVTLPAPLCSQVAVESALLVSYKEATLPDKGVVLGKAGNAFLHFLVRRDLALNQGATGKPLANLRIALNSERLQGDTEILTALGASQVLSLSIADGFDALYGNGVDGVFFLDLPPNPYALVALTSGRARQVSLRLTGEPTTTHRSGLYGGALFGPHPVRPVHWVLGETASPWQTILDREAESAFCAPFRRRRG